MSRSTSGQAEPDVVVVGAGAAGLAATRTLLDRGITVTLVEASGRIGGRAPTDTETFGVPFDRGAHWLHNGERNPYHGYARDQGFAIYPAPEESRLFVDDREATDDEVAAMWRAWEAFEDAMAAAAAKGNDVAAADVMPTLGDWDHTAAFAVGPWGRGKDVADFSSLGVWPGGADHFCPGGFGALVAHYGDGVPVSLDTEVKHIDWSGSGVRVETTRGTLCAKAVIVTVSLGVLSAGHIAFSPVLPAARLDLIHRFPMGCYNHIGLQFSEDIFGMGADGLLFYQVGEDLRAFGTLTNGGGTGIAYCDVGGRFGRELERAGDEVALDFVLEKLKALFGADIERTLVASAVTAWGRDRLFEGCYPSADPGASHLRAALSEPLGDRIFFAGDAYSDELWASVGGAHETGIAAANDVAVSLVKQR